MDETEKKRKELRHLKEEQEKIEDAHLSEKRQMRTKIIEFESKINEMERKDKIKEKASLIDKQKDLLKA